MAAFSLDDLKRVIEKYWGYRTFRPLQEAAMRAVMEGRDSLVVLPTGGGKSLCYQAPAVLASGATVVVSPLIALMKDQVDALLGCGIPAVRLDSSLAPEERLVAEQKLRQGEVRLLFVSPERLASDDFCRFLQKLNVQTFAIDEAHCISHWGHDFRPEYRQLRRLKELFPQVSVHGYTATATERVRADICQQLGLGNPEVLVGSFDRANLNYRILPKLDEDRQVLDVLRRHKKEAGIVYCIRRVDVDELAATLKRQGHRVMAYHAGMEAEERKAAQDAFAAETCDVIVATVAFGMGIDRPNIRFVLHTGLPKSIEHYQQETGRAGRDGLEAECVLLYSLGDFMTWKRILEKSARENNADPQYLASSLKHLDEINRYCQKQTCRHKALVEYFGQRYAVPTCQACDVCLGDTEPVPDAAVVAQKILSCVARVQERFGAQHVVDVLRGANTEKIRSFQHEHLSTYGLLRGVEPIQIRNWIYQLLGQGVLAQDGGDRPVLRLNPASWEVMRKERSVRLVQPARRIREEAPLPSRAEGQSWEGVDRELFEELRNLRRDQARIHQIPAYIIFGDTTLRALARYRPSTLAHMAHIYGIGQKKLRDWGDIFLQTIIAFCKAHGLLMDIVAPAKDTFLTEPQEDDLTPSEETSNNYWKGVDLALYEALNQERLRLAQDHDVAPSAVISEYSLRELARVRPANLEQMGHVAALSTAQLSEVGPIFMNIIGRHGKTKNV